MLCGLRLYEVFRPLPKGVEAGLVREFFWPVSMLQSGLDISAIVTHKFPVADFQKAFGALFESAPSLAVYQSTKFHQW